MADNPRIEALRRRVQSDPASIAFAQLAEELRRAGQYNEAINTCHAGLTIHPGYLSARVTLGRSLIEVGDVDAAEVELRHVLQHAPENLAAIRGLAEIHHRRGQLADALKFYQLALSLAKHDPDLEQTVSEISRALTPSSPPADEGMTFAEAQAEFLAALDGFEAESDSTAPIAPNESTFAPTAPIAMVDEPNPSTFAPSAHVATVDKPTLAPTAPIAMVDKPHVSASARPDPTELGRDRPSLLELERFLSAIHSYRQRRAG